MRHRPEEVSQRQLNGHLCQSTEQDCPVLLQRATQKTVSFTDSRRKMLKLLSKSISIAHHVTV